GSSIFLNNISVATFPISVVGCATQVRRGVKLVAQSASSKLNTLTEAGQETCKLPKARRRPNVMRLLQEKTAVGRGCKRISSVPHLKPVSTWKSPNLTYSSGIDNPASLIA